jgi:NAD(P)-dependent dehydrogenase (short-subunit alcohol dehydrogenase family)
MRWRPPGHASGELALRYRIPLGTVSTVEAVLHGWRAGAPIVNQWFEPWRARGQGGAGHGGRERHWCRNRPGASGRGALVVGLDRDAAGLGRVEGIEPVTGSVAVRADVERAVTLAESRFGGLDILVNNAAVQNTRPLLETTDAEWDEVIAVKPHRRLPCAACGGPGDAARGGGAIVNVSSTFALVGSPGYAAYHASKGGLSALGRGGGHRPATYGIRVNSVCPAPPTRPACMPASPKATRSRGGSCRYLALQPAKRFGRATEIAAAIVFLASDEASFITGAELVVDGGYTAV